MTHDEFVELVVDRWDEARARGVAIDPREICRADPELAKIAEAHPQLLDRVEDEISELTVGGNMVELARIALRTAVASPLPSREATRLAVGTKVTIENTYAVQEVTADGGQGVVYRMHNLDLKSSVSAKLLDVDPTHLEFDGVTAAAQFNHPGIPFVVGCGETEDGQPIYLMRLIEGQDFSESLRANRHDLRRHLYDFISVCNTAHFAHERGAVHCDIKPRNIRVGENGGEVVLLDWDTAVSMDSRFRAPREYFTRGTPGYAPPELLGEASPKPSRKVDVYSLGAVLYQILMGEKPRSAEHNGAALRNVRKGLRPLASIVSKAMQADPTDRYDTAYEVAEEVTRWLESREVRAHRYRPTERVWAAIKRPTTMSKIMLTAASLLFLGMVAALWVVRSQNQHLEAAERDGLRVSARLCADYVGRQFQDRWTFLEHAAGRIVSDDALLHDLTAAATDYDMLYQSRLQDWIRDDTLSRIEAPRAASCFVLNKDGIQIAKLTRNDPMSKEPTLGRDFHDRSYFQGDDGEPIATFSVSSAYKSKSTNKTRIAFSIPIRRDGEFLGVIGMSANVRGDVRFLPPWLRDDDIVTVVDVKRTDDDVGGREGAFLVHPSYTRALEEGKPEPSPLFESAAYLDRYQALGGRRYNQLQNASESGRPLPFLENYEKAYFDEVRQEPYRMVFEPVIVEYAGTLLDTGLVVKIQRK